MVFNDTFNNISVTSRRSALLVEETGGHGENHRPVASHWQTLSHNVVSSTPRHEYSIHYVFVTLKSIDWVYHLQYSQGSDLLRIYKIKYERTSVY